MPVTVHPRRGGRLGAARRGLGHSRVAAAVVATSVDHNVAVGHMTVGVGGHSGLLGECPAGLGVPPGHDSAALDLADGAAGGVALQGADVGRVLDAERELRGVVQLHLEKCVDVL